MLNPLTHITNVKMDNKPTYGLIIISILQVKNLELKFIKLALW